MAVKKGRRPLSHDFRKARQPAGNDGAVAVARLGPGAREIEILDGRRLGKPAGSRIVESLVPAVDRAAIIPRVSPMGQGRRDLLDFYGLRETGQENVLDLFDQDVGDAFLLGLVFLLLSSTIIRFETGPGLVALKHQDIDRILPRRRVLHIDIIAAHHAETGILHIGFQVFLVASVVIKPGRIKHLAVRDLQLADQVFLEAKKDLKTREADAHLLESRQVVLEIFLP